MAEYVKCQGGCTAPRTHRYPHDQVLWDGLVDLVAHHEWRASRGLGNSDRLLTLVLENAAMTFERWQVPAEMAEDLDRRIMALCSARQPTLAEQRLAASAL